MTKKSIFKPVLYIALAIIPITIIDYCDGDNVYCNDRDANLNQLFLHVNKEIEIFSSFPRFN